MNNYRLYFLTSCGLHIDAVKTIHANGDAAAIEVAKGYRGRYPIELWWRARKVQSFAAFDRPRSPAADRDTEPARGKLEELLVLARCDVSDPASRWKGAFAA